MSKDRLFHAVIRNIYFPEQTIQSGIGMLRLKCLMLEDRTGNRIGCNSLLLPPYLKRVKNLRELLACLIPAMHIQ
ncbi:MAG: hypothetical protein ACTS73_01175 [Arsenophonus sp. NEOnobi-MAG3]